MPFQENFVGTQGTLVSSRSGWSVAGSTGTDVAILDGNGFLGTTDTGNTAAMVYHVLPSADHYAQAVMGSNFGGGAALLLLDVRQGTTRGSGYTISYVSGTGQWQLRNANTLGVLTTVTNPTVAGDTIRLSAVGTTIAVSRNGSTIISLVEGTFPSQTNVGLQPRTNTTSNASNSILTSFEADTLGGGGGGTTFVTLGPLLEGRAFSVLNGQVTT